MLNNSYSGILGPGSCFQIDATLIDAHMVSSINRSNLIGRALIYTIIDVYSKFITGLYVSIENDSELTAMFGLDTMVQNKVQFCQKYGIIISEKDWPSNHLPLNIRADRGACISKKLSSLVNNYHISIENTPPYRGDLKGIVERYIGSINAYIKGKLSEAGAIKKDFHQRGDPDYREYAKLTLDEITKIAIIHALIHNSKPIDKQPIIVNMVHDYINPCPINLWNWGIENQGILRVVNREDFLFCILPRAKVTYFRGIVKYKCINYSSNELIILINLILRIHHLN